MDDDIKKEMLADNFPSNSRAQRRTNAADKEPERKKLEKVVTGKVKKKKRGFGKRVAESICEDDTRNVGSYVIHDILIPAAKDLLSDMVGGGVDMLLFGERRSNRGYRGNGRSGGGRSYTSYGSYYSSSNKDRDRDRNPRDREREISRQGRARHDFDEIIIDDRGEAEVVLGHLVDLILDYDQATVGDFYDLVDVTSNFTDNKYGWTDLRGVKVIRARGGGYIIDLPRAQLLD